MSQEEQLNIQLKAAEKAVELGKALGRLAQNPDFKAVFTEHYFKDYAHDQVTCLTKPGMTTRKMRKTITESLVGISSLKSYLSFIAVAAENMERSLAEYHADTEDEEGEG